MEQVMAEKKTYRVAVPELKTSFDVEEGEIILDAALRQNVELPFGCRLGMCRACMVKVEGDAVHVDEPALSQTEIDQGYRLICCCEARSDLVLDYASE
jgi:ferredoxin